MRDVTLLRLLGSGECSSQTVARPRIVESAESCDLTLDPGFSTQSKTGFRLVDIKELSDPGIGDHRLDNVLSGVDGGKLQQILGRGNDGEILFEIIGGN